MASKRLPMVPVDSSAARMPLPGATMANATLFNSSKFMLPSIAIKSFLPQHLDPRQGLALKPFQESAAGCGYISQPVDDAGDVERGHRVATARHRDKLAGGGQFRRGLRDFDGAGVEGFHLEGAERAV